MTKKETNSITANHHTLESTKKLSIQVSLNGLSFCVFDTASNSIAKTENLAFEQSYTPYQVLKELKKLLGDHQLPTEKFLEVVVVHRNQLFSLVPTPLFDPNELANYLKYNTKLLANDHLAYDELSNHEMVNVYVPFVNINNYIYELFGEFTFKHNGTVIIESLLKNQNLSNQPFALSIY